MLVLTKFLNPYLVTMIFSLFLLISTACSANATKLSPIYEYITNKDGKKLALKYKVDGKEISGELAIHKQYNTLLFVSCDQKYILSAEKDVFRMRYNCSRDFCAWPKDKLVIEDGIERGIISGLVSHIAKSKGTRVVLTGSPKTCSVCTEKPEVTFNTTPDFLIKPNTLPEVQKSISTYLAQTKTSKSSRKRYGGSGGGTSGGGSGKCYMRRPIKIGSMSPLTGPYAADGIAIKNAVLTAVETFKNQTNIEIEFYPQDTACDPRQAVAAANKLINLEVAGVVGAYCSSSTIPASEVLDEEDIIMITPAATNEKVTDRGLSYMFRVCGRDDDEAPTAVKFMRKVLGARTVFIVDDKTDYSQGVANDVSKVARSMGMNVVAHKHVNQGDKDFSGILSMAKRASADVFYMSLQGFSPAAMMTLQAKRMGLKSRIVTQAAVFQPKYMAVAKEASRGIYLTYGYTDHRTPEYKAFEKLYRPKYGEISAYAPYAYDATLIMLKAIESACSTDSSKIKAEMMKMDYQGVTKLVKFNKKGDAGTSVIVFKVVGGEFIPYWEPSNGLIK
jgi:branched-chain amino acid transport system substrate-binding protein